MCPVSGESRPQIKWVDFASEQMKVFGNMIDTSMLFGNGGGIVVHGQICDWTPGEADTIRSFDGAYWISDMTHGAYLRPAQSTWFGPPGWQVQASAL